VQAIQGRPLTIYGDGSQTRSFCYVDDLIEVMIRLMDTDDAITGPINIGNPKEFSILELAEKIINLSGSSSEIIFKPLPADDPKQRKPDISLAKKQLNWEPNIRLEDGLLRTIEYFRSVVQPKDHLQKS
jgi:UDP-glucuronate decarboxylase